MAQTTLESTPKDAANLVQGLSGLCFIMGFASIVASIAAWAMSKEPNAAHGERFGIFIGLWAPTFFILADRLSRQRPTS